MSKQNARDCALYLRISLDATGEGLAVQRQREDCQRIAKERGWRVVETYAESVSASDRAKRRPEYERMVADYEAGRFDALICWDLDRLTRQPRQLEDWIDAADEHGLILVTANGEADLSTDGGRLFARIKASVARAEVERKGARQRRAIAQRVERGKVPAGVRLTGYAKDGSILETEADMVRRIFALFNAGESLNGIARELNERGFKSRRGPWTSSSVRTVLLNPRYCGRQVFQGKATGHLGEWEPIVTEAEWDSASAILTDPRRTTNRAGTHRRHLGSGLYLCGICDSPVRAHTGNGITRYRCKDAHVLRSGKLIDNYVLGIVRAYLDSPAVSLDLTPADPDDTTAQEVERLRRRVAEIEKDYDSGHIDGRRFAIATEKAHAELKTAERAHASARTGSAFASIAGAPKPSAAFDTAPLGVQRAVVGELLTVRLFPAPRGRKTFDPETVQVEWSGS